MAATKGPKLKISIFDVNEDRLDCSRLWKRYLERFERELIYSGVDPKANPGIAKAALLIHAGEAVEDIHDSLPDPIAKPEDVADAADWHDYAKAKRKLTAYFSPQVCNDFAIHELINTKIMSGESIAAYTVRLREAAKKCSFDNWNADKMIKAVLISNMNDTELRVKLLQKDRTLDQILQKAQQREDARARDKVMHKGNGGSINKMGTKWPNRRQKDKAGAGGHKDPVKNCNNCGYESHNYNKCPARDRRCVTCGELGHFKRTRACKGKASASAMKVRHGDTESDTDSDGDSECNKVTVLNVSNQEVTLMKIMMDGVETVWQPDTGTKKNLMDITQLRKFEVEQNCKISLMPTSTRLFPYGSEESLTVMGKFDARFQAGEKEVDHAVYVTKEKTEFPLISELTATQLGLVKYNERFVIKKVNGADVGRDVGETVKGMFPELFTGKTGRVKGKAVKIMVDEDVIPVAQAPRRIPIHLVGKAEAKVAALLKDDIIERYPDNEPREWINPNVISKKSSGDIRLCQDMRLVNGAIQRPLTTIPTLEEVKAKFAGAERFSKLDLKEAYNQIELAPESRKLTAFYGPDGLYRYKRLNYGTKSSQDIMQIELQRILAGIPYQMNMADDILIGGTVEQHDQAVVEVCRSLSRAGVTLNPEKCLFDKTQVSFMGLIFSKEGIKPDPKHVKNLCEAEVPRNQAELRSFLGMAGYSMNFIENFAAIVHPLRELQKKSRWEWDESCENAVSKLKASLSEQTLLCHYMPGRETQVVVDASGSGLGACLVQRKSKQQPFRVVSYRSRALKDAETRYSATEREALAIRWAVKKMRNLLLGGPPFKVISDHKPLQAMFNKKSGETPPRIERFIMDLQEYDFVVEYLPGKQMIADFLSRNHGQRTGSSPVVTNEKLVGKIMEAEVVHAVNSDSAITMENVREATAQCAIMQRVIAELQAGFQTRDPELEPFKKVADQLSTINGVVCKGTRIVIPESLRKRVVRLCHKSHQGMTKAKSLARSFCWFPGMDAAIEGKIGRCVTCQAVQDKNLTQPIKPHELPEGPWQILEMDFQGPYPNGEYVFVMVDRYSRWPECRVLKRAPDAKTTCKVIRDIVRSHGCPVMVQSDNGPPFQSREMSEFASNIGYKHKHITPEWPKANGMVERFNRSMKEAVQAGYLEGKTLQEAVADFVEVYRATPHSATLVSPFEAMHGGRKMKLMLPLMKEIDGVVDRGIDKEYKRKMGEKRSGKQHQLEVGDSVLMRQKKENKLSTPFSPVKLEVTKVEGSSVQVTDRNGSNTYRDASFFKRIESDESEDEPEAPMPAGQDDGLEGVGDMDGGEVADQEAELDDGGNTTSTATERPRRERRPPVRLGDYAC